jgi:hypothetical protein
MTEAADGGLWVTELTLRQKHLAPTCLAASDSILAIGVAKGRLYVYERNFTPFLTINFQQMLDIQSILFSAIEAPDIKNTLMKSALKLFCIAIHPESSLKLIAVATSSDHMILYSLIRNQSQSIIKVHDHEVSCMQWHPNGEYYHEFHSEAKNYVCFLESY